MKQFKVNLHTDNEERELLLDAGSYLIGSDADCPLRVRSSEVLPRHAFLHLHESGHELEELGPDGSSPTNSLGTRSFHPYPASIQVGPASIHIDSGADDIPKKGPRPGIIHADSKEQPGEMIASGGMGEIYRIDEPHLGRTVARKTMKRTALKSEISRRRFHREAVVLARLEHPNIVPLHEFGNDDDGDPYYTMKLVKGRTLREILNAIDGGDPETVRGFPLERLLSILLKICDAIASAHHNGVIHRDLKPANIMVGEFGEVLVMDWGLARLTERWIGPDSSPIDESNLEGDSSGEKESVDLTNDGAVLGSPQYMAPEQAAGRIAETDERTDIYGLGGILYSILTLNPPVLGRSTREMVEKIQSGEIDPPSSYNNRPRQHDASGRPNGQPESHFQSQLPHCPNHRIPQALSAVAMKALSPVPGNRYTEARELAADIRAYTGGFATSVEQLSFLGQLTLLVRRHRGVSACIGVALLITGILIHRLVLSQQAATQSAREANQNAAQARFESDRSLRTMKLSNHRLYVATMRQVQSLWNRNAIDAARALLNETSTSPHRGWEWHFWNNRMPRYRAVLNGHTGRVTDVAVSPDGNWIATAATDRTVKLWRAADGQLEHSFQGHRSSINRVVFTADSGAIVSASGDRTVRVWNIERREIEHVLAAHAGNVKALAASPDGRMIFSGGEDRVGIVWDRHTGEQIHRLTGHTATITAAAFDPESSRLATAGRNLRFWNPHSGYEFGSTRLSGSALDLAFDQSGQHVFLGLNSGLVLKWDITLRDNIIRSFKIHSPLLLDTTPDSPLVLHGADHFLLEIRDQRSLQLLKKIPGHRDTFYGLALSPDAKWYVSGGRDTTARIGDIGTIRSPTDTFVGHAINAIIPDISEDGRTMLTTSKDGSIRIWNVATGESIRRIQRKPGTFGQRWYFPDGIFSHDDRQAIVASFDQVDTWDIESGERVSNYTNHNELILDISQAPDGTRNATSSQGSTQVWSTDSGKLIQRFDDSKRIGVFDSKFLPDSVSLLVGSGDGSLRILNTDTGDEQLRLPGHSQKIWTVDVDREGQLLASGGDGGIVRVWDASTGELLHDLPGHSGMVRGVRFLGDRSRLISVDRMGTIKIWDTEIGRELMSFQESDPVIYGLACTPSGSHVVAAGKDRTSKAWIKLWELAP